MTRRKWPWWVLAVIAAFLLGLWLGRGPAAKARLPCGPPGTVQTSPGKGNPGPGAPAKLGGPGSGDAPPLGGGGGTSKAPRGSGREGEGRDDGGKDSGPGKSSQADMGDGDATPPSTAQGDLVKTDLAKYLDGKEGLDGVGHVAEAAAAPAGKSYRADDFTYDKTNLPRYPDSVDAVVSSISYGPGGPTDPLSTGAGIVTSSPFATVVAWYRDRLPGWHETTIGDMGQLSTQLSAQSLINMLGAQLNGGSKALDTSTPATSTPASPTADRLRISLFTPPAGGPRSGVMIEQHGDGPVEALLQAKLAPAP